MTPEPYEIGVSQPAIEVEASTRDFALPADDRPRMPEPPPVRLVAVEEVHLPAAAGLELQLDEFYVTMLQFDRDDAGVSEPQSAQLAYRAENFHIRFDLIELRPQRQDFRPLTIEVCSLPEIEQKLIDGKLEYERIKGLLPAEQALLLRDPAGNWVSLVERREMM